jgi:uncharacterized protein (DUF983 family)
MAGKPGFLWSLLTQKCPHCREGNMFTNPNPWHLRTMLKMPPRCTECGQLFELEVGFWYGTAYVSYALTVLFSGLSFALWWLTIGFALTDQRFFWWLGINGVLLVVLQPWFMRLSRALYLYFFVSYSEDYKNTATKTFDYSSEGYFLREEKTKPKT